MSKHYFFTLLPAFGNLLLSVQIFLKSDRIDSELIFVNNFYTFFKDVD